MTYISTKTYGHDLGLSCAFRQWRAHDSHCKFLHGYAIGVRIEFEAEKLDTRNWVVDFGGLKTLKGWLEDLLDHKTLVAKDDPHYKWFKIGHESKIIDMVEVDRTGCEAMAEMIYGAVDVWLGDNGYGDRVKVRQVEVKEHGANSAIYKDTPHRVVHDPGTGGPVKFGEDQT